MNDVPGAGARGPTETTEPTAAQRAFARNVAESKATIPHVYFEAGIAAAPRLPALVAAAAGALRAVPLLNGAYRDGHFERYGRVNVAVGLPVEGTLSLPVIADADGLTVDEIDAKLSDLAAAASAGTLAAPAFAGATFAIVDMSPSGATRFVPAVHRGLAATLGVGGQTLTLACDARIAQGGEGGELVSRIAAAMAA